MPEAARSLTASPICRSSGKSHNLTPLRLVGGTVAAPPPSGGFALALPVQPVPALSSDGDDNTPVWYGFQRWAEIVNWVNTLRGDALDQFCSLEIDAQETLLQLPVHTARDLACKAWVSLIAEGAYGRVDFPACHSDDLGAGSQAFVNEIALVYPEIEATAKGQRA